MLRNLKSEIFARGMKQYVLAAELGIPAPVLTEILHGRRQLTAELRTRIVALFPEVDPKWLLADSNSSGASRANGPGGHARTAPARA